MNKSVSRLYDGLVDRLPTFIMKSFLIKRKKVDIVYSSKYAWNGVMNAIDNLWYFKLLMEGMEICW